MNDQTPIIFTLGEETQPKIEGFDDYGTSLFKEQYIKSFDWVTSYLNKIEKAKATKNEEALRELNNVLAYIGERGSGKTSCMLSVAEMLKAEPNVRERHDIMPDVKEEFLVLDHIDPSFFDTKNNILSLIIARLFGEFDKDKHPNDERKPKLKHELLELFKKVNDNIDLLLDKKKEFSEDSLQRIDDLAAAVNLRDNIAHLVTKYLVFFDGHVLVIPVDDVDLHTSEAYKMVEQIRKYLMLPNVIVLFAVKLDQLAWVIKKQYVDEFGRLLKLMPSPNAKENVLDIGIVEEMVDRYCGKFIPLGQRIYLTDTEGLFYKRLQINGEDGKPLKDGKGEELPPFDTIREAIPALIFEKTRYLFYNSSAVTSPIVPRNLRELRHLVYMLCNMKDYWADNNTSGEYNKTLFKKYFFESWTVANLNVQDQEIVRSLLHITDAVVFNKMAVMALKNRFMQGAFNMPEYNYIMHESNAVFNISVGDVMALVRYLERTVYHTADTKLLFMIRSIYSMRLYEYYDEYTYNYNDDPLSAKMPTVVKKDNEVRRAGIMPDVSNFEKFVGGSFINSNQEIISLLQEDRNNERAQRKINIQSVTNPRLLSEFNLTKEQSVIVREFFALTTSRKYDSKDSTSRFRYRSTDISLAPYYRQDLSKADNGLFDIACIFANLLNIKKCYSRFDTELYQAALDAKWIYDDEGKVKTKGSILNWLIEKTRKRDGEEMIGAKLGKRMFSWFSIRNAEILDDLVEHLSVVDYRHVEGERKENRNKEILQRFFEEISKYRMKTYDKKYGKAIEVDFSFVDILADVVGGMGGNVFDHFYSSSENKVPDKFNAEFILKKTQKKSTITSENIRSKIRKFFPLDYKTHKDKIDELFSEHEYQYAEIVKKMNDLEAYINNK